MNFKHINSLFCFSLALLFGNCDKIKYNFPNDIKDMCYGELNSARACIVSKGTKLEERWSCTVKKVMTCDKLATSGYWCWFEPNLGMYVGGWQRGTYIKIGCNPQTGGDVKGFVIKHEFGHFWLASNHYYSKDSDPHPGLYSRCFFKWIPRANTFTTTRLNYLETLSYVQIVYSNSPAETWISMSGVDDNGEFYHYDIVILE